MFRHLRLPIRHSPFFSDIRVQGSFLTYAGRAITRDETLFPNASAFLPERYLEKVDPALAKKRDPRTYVFVSPLSLIALQTCNNSTRALDGGGVQGLTW
jgi:hypothetical protein